MKGKLKIQKAKLKCEMKDERSRIIRASEIGQYRYCARAWWLNSVLGVPSANTRELAGGEQQHQTHGRKVWVSNGLRWVALALLVVGAVVLLIGLM